MSGRVRLTNAIRGDLRFLRLLLSVAYWTALDEPVKSSTFFCILEHPSREAAAANWKALQDDSERKTVKAKSEEHGKLVEKIDSTFLPPTDFPRYHGSEISRPANFDERRCGGYQRPMWAPPSTWSTSPVTWPASAR